MSCNRFTNLAKRNNMLFNVYGYKKKSEFDYGLENAVFVFVVAHHGDTFCCFVLFLLRMRSLCKALLQLFLWSVQKGITRLVAVSSVQVYCFECVTCKA